MGYPIQYESTNEKSTSAVIRIAVCEESCIPRCETAFASKMDGDPLLPCTCRHLLHHSKHQLAVTVIQADRVAADLA